MRPHLTAALELLVSLKAVLAEVAREVNLPAFKVFYDATLRAIAERARQSLEELDGISEITVKKPNAYGAEILPVRS